MNTKKLFVFACMLLASCTLDTTPDGAPQPVAGSVAVSEQPLAQPVICPYRRVNVQEFAMWVVGSPYTGDYTCLNTSPSVWFCRSPNWPDYVRLYYPPQVAPSPSNPCPRLIADFIECSNAIGGCNGPTGRVSCTGYTTNAYNECR